MRRVILAALAGLALSSAIAAAQPIEPIGNHFDLSNPRDLTRVRQSLFFVADSSSMGLSLWKANEPFEQATLLAFSFGNQPSISELTAWNGALYFALYDQNRGNELWRSDGTFQGTSLLHEVADFFFSSDPRELTPSGRYLFFSAADQFGRRDLWRTNGTPQGLVRLPIPFSSQGLPHGLVDLNGVLLFVATEDFHGEALWRSDGTFEGTAVVADVNPGPAGAIGNLTVLGGLAYFTADDGVRGVELWSTDGTQFGTLPVPEVRPGPESSSPQELTVVRGVLYFTADDGIHGRELWKLVPGQFPEMVADIVPGPAGSSPTSLRNVEGRLFFVADDGQTGAEPWTSDGTVFGTLMVGDLIAPPFSSSPDQLTDVNGTLMFQAHTPGGGGRELWTFSGQPPFNPPIPFDLNPGPPGSNASQFTVADDRVYLVADGGQLGVDLWTLRNIPPIAVAGPDQEVPPGTLVSLVGFGSHDPDGFPFQLSFEWRDEEGAVLTRDPFVSVPVSEGTHEYTLIVRDSLGGRAEDTVRVGTPGRTAPVVTITSPAAGEVLTVGEPTEIRWTATDDEGIAAARVLLSVDGGVTYTPLPGCDVPGPATSCTWTPPTVVERAFLRVEATDDMGDRGRQTIAIEVAPPPTGPQLLEITVDGLGGQGFDFVLADLGFSCSNSPAQPVTTCPFTLDPGMDVRMFAQPGPGSVFVGWSGNCTGTGECTVTMNGTRRVTATFRPPPQVTLTLTVDSLDNGAGGVQVFGSDGTFNLCEAVPGTTQTCTFSYTQGTFVGLFPNPAPDTTFLGFAGACTGTNPCQMLLEEAATSVAATFRGPGTFDLTVTAESFGGGAGRIEVLEGPGQLLGTCEATPGSSQTCTFPARQGSSLFLFPFPGPDSAFVGWSGACTGTDPCPVFMDEPKQMTGRFAGQQTLTVTIVSVDDGLGRIDAVAPGGFPQGCDGVPGTTQTCTLQFLAGTTVQVMPMWANDSEFTGWSGACTGTGNPCSVTMDGPQQLTATFRGPQTLTVSIVSVDNGLGRIDAVSPGGGPQGCDGVPGSTQTCTLRFPPGSNVSIGPTWANDSVFTGWSGDCSGDGPCSVTMTGPRQVTATFRGPQTLTVTVESVDNGAGHVDLIGEDGVPHACQGVPGSTQTCTFQFRLGSNLSLSPTGAPDSVFTGWLGACTGNGPCAVAMNGAQQVTARFRGPQTLTVQVNGLNGGSGRVDLSFGPGVCENSPGIPAVCTFSVPLNTNVSFAALPHPGSLFTGWGGACEGMSPCAVTMSGPVTVTATFDIANRPPVANPGGPYAGVRNQPIAFNGSGSSDPDGDPLTYGWDFGDGTQGSGVAPTHAYSTLDTFTVTLTVSDGHVTSAPATTSVTISNIPPVANPGGPYAGIRNQAIVFNGAGSSDPDGDPLTYGWDFGDGTQGSGVAPTHAYSTLGTFTVTLTVSDGHVTSAPATTTVTISNVPPVANPGGPYSGVRNQAIAFNGAGSSDPDGDPLTYAWNFGDGTQGSGVAPTHAYSTLGTFTVTLTVSDGHAASAPAMTTVTITNVPPQANAGPDRTVERKTIVVLDGRASTDPDGSIAAYKWRQVAGPAVTLVGATHAVAAFQAPNVQNPVVLEFELKVTDNDGAAATDRVRITVTR